ncbi:MAG: replication initiator protein A [Parvimonas sp.]|uniref:replication initiator protein A n=1 Tax=Parvimonas sp. TaxID=1944660 RepID=UPI002A75689C|nr:replication initiator protein A [Parvimonas sp.]MDY3050835.1 replication initiator protein A [Parvimonas sp.]
MKEFLKQRAYNIDKYNNEYRFYQVPTSLLSCKKFKKMSPASKLLYAILRSRQNLSIKNGWVDESGFIYSIYKVEDLSELIGSAESSIIRWKKELREHFLIDEVQVGMTKCNRIYVFDVNTSNTLEDEKRMYEAEEIEEKNTEINGQISIENFVQNSNNLSINQSLIEEKEKANYEEYEKILKENFELERLKKSEKEETEELIALILDTICFKKDYEKVKIGDRFLPISLVKKRLLNLKKHHVDYTLESIRKAPKICNIKSYLLTSLYNSYSTFNQSITNDMKDF